MRSSRWFRPVVLALGTAALAACTEMDEDGLTPPEQQQSGVAAQGDDLFTILQARTLAGLQASRVQAIREQAATVEVHLATVASNREALLQEGSRIGLRVSPTRRVVAIGEERFDSGDGYIGWEGRIEGGQGSVTLIMGNRGIGGTLDVGEEHYMIESIGNGLHAISRYDPGRLPSDHGPNWPGTSGRQLQLEQVLGQIPIEPAEGALATVHKIRVLVGYTARVAQRLDDPGIKIHLAKRKTNESYGNSGIGNVVVTLSPQWQVTYDERNANHDLYTDHRDALTDVHDGLMDYHAVVRRQRYDADVVVVLVDDQDEGICGIAERILAEYQTATAIVNYQCVGRAGQWSFAHEIGHLQGADHNQGNDCENRPRCGPYEYGHGFRGPNEAWRTVMAYDLPCEFPNCPRIPRILFWSNPNKMRDGHPMGTTDDENNARVLRQTARRVSQFVPSVSIDGPEGINTVGARTWTATELVGNGPFSYQWSAYYFLSEQTVQLGHQKEQTIYFSEGEESDIRIVVKATSESGNTAHAQLRVCVAGCGPLPPPLGG